MKRQEQEMNGGVDVSQGYWTVSLEVFAFETKDDAVRFREALEDAFTSISEAKNYTGATSIRHEQDDAERLPTQLGTGLKR